MRQGIKLALGAVAVALALPAAASAQEVGVIEDGDPPSPFLWDDESVQIQPGESVLWRFTPLSSPVGQPPSYVHNVSIYDNPDAAGTPIVSSPYYIPTAPVEEHETFQHTFDDEGAFAYICDIHPDSMRGVVQVGDPPPVGDPELYLGLKRKRARGKFRKVTSFPAIIRNTGDALMQDAMVCARAPRRLVKVTDGRCASYAGLGEGETRRPKFTFKPKKRARGRKVTIKFVASATGLPNKTKKATLKVRR